MKYLALFIPFLFGGCCFHGPTHVVIRDAWEVIHVEYDAYLEADPRLDKDQKANRKETARTLSMLLDELTGVEPMFSP